MVFLLWYNGLMDSNIIVALITLSGTLIVAIIGLIVRIRSESVKNAIREQEQKDLFNQLFIKMDGIEKRLDEHNHYAEKIGDIRVDLSKMQKDIEYLRKEK